MLEKYHLVDLPWDSDYFGIAVSRVDLLSELTEGEFSELREVVKKYDFLTISNPKGLQNNNRFISEILSAYLVDVNVTFSKRKVGEESVTCNKQDYEVVNADQIGNLDDIVKIAGESFVNSRFYNDTNISNEKASQLYINWIKQSINHNNTYFSLYVKNGRCKGFLLFSKKNTEWVIELVAVDKSCRNMHIGKRLMQNAISFDGIVDNAIIKVGTQIENISAMNYYYSSGFVIKDIKYIYHLWIK